MVGAPGTTVFKEVLGIHAARPMSAPAATRSQDKLTQPSWREFLSVQSEQEFSSLRGKEGEDAVSLEGHASSVLLHPHLLIAALEVGDGVRARKLALHPLRAVREKVA